MSHTITALVSNKSGVLTRVSGLFARRGYNIDSLSVCATEDDKLSRMTIVLNGDDYVLEQMVKQLDKLIDVKKICLMSDDNAVYRELLLIKIAAGEKERSQIMDIKDIYKAKIVDLSPCSMILEITGEPSKLNAFINILQPYKILEMARTGVTALQRGDVCIKDLTDYNDII